MNINPTDTAGMPAQMPIYNPMMPVGQNEQEEEGEPAQPSSASSFTSIDKQFDALIKHLTQQLSALEKELMQALKQLNVGKQAPQIVSPCPSGPRKPPGFQRYGSFVLDAARRHEIDPHLVNAVINQESGFQPNAVSKAGAVGLMQLMPDTAKSLGVKDPFNPQQNIEGGTTLLRGLLDRYHGQLDLALAAYNAGPGAVDKYGGVPPYPETQAYVRNIMESYRESAFSA
jgi:soluble lytic murein transglycosylase-like protein